MLVAISASKDFTAAQLMPPTLTRAAMLAIVIASAAANAEPIRFEVGGESLGELWLEPTIDLDAGIATATLAVGTEREPIYYVLQVSSEPLDSDHIIVQQPPDHPDMRTRLDVTGAHFVLERSGPLVVGDEWELFGVDELVGEETITFSSFRLDVWDFGGLTNDQFGGHSILYVGLPLDVRCGYCYQRWISHWETLTASMELIYLTFLHSLGISVTLMRDTQMVTWIAVERSTLLTFCCWRAISVVGQEWCRYPSQTTSRDFLSYRPASLF